MRLFLAGTILILGLGASAGPAFSGSPSGNEEGPSTSQKAVLYDPDGAIGGDSTGITIEAKNRSLGEVLDQVERRANIRFKAVDSLKRKKVAENIQASDWDSGVQKLLKGLSRIEIWDADSRLSQVVLLNSGDGDGRSLPSVQSDETGGNRRGIPGHVKDARGRDVDLSTVPQQFLFEPGVVNFLRALGLQLPEEMYGLVLKDIPSDLPVPPHIRYDRRFLHFLKSIDAELPSETLASARQSL